MPPQIINIKKNTMSNKDSLTEHDIEILFDPSRKYILEELQKHNALLDTSVTVRINNNETGLDLLLTGPLTQVYTVIEFYEQIEEHGFDEDLITIH